MRAADAQPGDLVRASDGSYYLAPEDDDEAWSTMQPIPFMGVGPEATAPDGDLELFGRGGKPVGSG